MIIPKKMNLDYLSVETVVKRNVLIYITNFKVFF